MGRVTRSSATEKLEITRIVEGLSLPVQQTLAELDIPRSTALPRRRTTTSPMARFHRCVIVLAQADRWR